MTPLLEFSRLPRPQKAACLRLWSRGTSYCHCKGAGAVAACRLALRSDSRLCQQYIEGKKLSLGWVVDVMDEMRFYFAHTDYEDRREELRKARRQRKHCILLQWSGEAGRALPVPAAAVACSHRPGLCHPLGLEPLGPSCLFLEPSLRFAHMLPCSHAPTHRRHTWSTGGATIQMKYQRRPSTPHWKPGPAARRWRPAWRRRPPACTPACAGSRAKSGGALAPDGGAAATARSRCPPAYSCPQSCCIIDLFMTLLVCSRPHPVKWGRWGRWGRGKPTQGAELCARCAHAAATSPKALCKRSLTLAFREQHFHDPPSEHVASQPARTARRRHADGANYTVTGCGPSMPDPSLSSEKALCSVYSPPRKAANEGRQVGAGVPPAVAGREFGHCQTLPGTYFNQFVQDRCYMPLQDQKTSASSRRHSSSRNSRQARGRTKRRRGRLRRGGGLLRWRQEQQRRSRSGICSCPSWLLSRCLRTV